METAPPRWFLAMAAMASQHGPHGELIVITHSASVARWSLHVASHRSGGTRWGVTPTVLRLGPREADGLLANGPPELAVFAAWVMQNRRGPGAVDLARRAIARTEAIADAQLRQRIQWSIPTVLHPAVVEKVRSIAMIDISQLPRNPALERWVSDLHAEGASRVLLRVLHQRAIAMTPVEETRILACMDSDQIERWTDRALTATLIDEVFAEP